MKVKTNLPLHDGLVRRNHLSWGEWKGSKNSQQKENEWELAVEERCTVKGTYY